MPKKHEARLQDRKTIEGEKEKEIKCRCNTGSYCHKHLRYWTIAPEKLKIYRVKYNLLLTKARGIRILRKDMRHVN